MTEKTLHAALIQHANKGSAADNLELIEAQAEAAARDGAQLLLLQELHNTAIFARPRTLRRLNLPKPSPVRRPSGLVNWRRGSVW
jgi:N-carbamoylputrescine amidase